MLQDKPNPGKDEVQRSLDSLPVPALVYTSEGRAVLYNRMARRELSAPEIERLGQQLPSWTSPSLRARDIQQIEQHGEISGPPVRRLDRRGGQLVATTTRVGMIRLREAGICRLVVVDPLPQAEPRSPQSTLPALLEQAPEATYVIDAHTGRILLANQRAAERLGYSTAELSGRHFAELSGLAELREASSWGELVLRLRGRGGQLLHFDHHVPRGGPAFPVEVQLRLMEQGDETLLLATARDISARREMEARVAQADRMLVLGTMATSIAHGVNNPLTTVLLNLRWMAEEAERRGLSEDVIARAKETIVETERAVRFARGLQAFAPPVPSTGGQEEDWVSLEQPLDVALSIMQNRCSSVQREMQPDLPQVRGRAEELAHLFLVVLLRASWSDRGAVSSSTALRVQIGHENGRVRVRVMGSGAHGERSLPPEWKAEANALAELWLELARRMLVPLGGAMGPVESGPQGIQLSFELPAGPLRPTSADISILPSQESARLKLLIVDDEAPILRSLERILSRNYDVTTARSGKDARLRIEAAPDHFDLLLCDLVMPEESGVTLYEWLLIHEPRLARRSIFMTGGAFTPQASDFVTRRLRPCLDKPFLTDELLRRLKKIERGQD